MWILNIMRQYAVLIRRILGYVVYESGSLKDPDGNAIGVGNSINPLYPYQLDLANLAPGTGIPAAGEFLMDSINVASVTHVYLRNTTAEGTGIGTFLSSIPPGMFIVIKSKLTSSYARYPINSITAVGSYRDFAVGALVNGIDFADNDECIIVFEGLANAYYDEVNGVWMYKGAAISNVLTYDTLSGALAGVPINALTDKLEFAVLDPGGNSANTFLAPIPWNLIVDLAANLIKQVGGMLDFAVNKGVFRYCQTAVNASGTSTVDATIAADRVRVTVTAHGLSALDANFPAYVIVKTTGSGWTVNEKVKILLIVDTNTLILDKAFSTLTTPFRPTLYVITETMPIVTVLCPPLRAWSHLKFYMNLQWPSSAGVKTLAANWGGTDYWATTFTTSKSLTRTVQIKNLGSTAKQLTNTQASSNTGTDALQSSGTTVTSTVTSSVATTFNVNMSLSAAADYVDVVMLDASCRL